MRSPLAANFLFALFALSHKCDVLRRRVGGVQAPHSHLPAWQLRRTRGGGGGGGGGGQEMKGTPLISYTSELDH